MKNYNYLYILFIIIIFSSCLSKKDLITGKSVIKDDLSVLNGTYKNIAANSKVSQDEFPLYLLLFKNYHWQNPFYNKAEDYDGSIKITAISDNKIKAERFVDGEIVKTKILKGKIHNNFFVTKRKWRIIGIPIIFGAYNESMIAIGLSPNGYLNIKKKFDFTGGIMPLMANGNTYIEKVFFTKTDSEGYDIYNETMNLAEMLSKENPDKYIFYKTDLHSIDSYVWYDKDDSIVSYKITPEGTEQKKILLSHYRTQFNPKETLVAPIVGLPSPNKSLIGYFEIINGKTMKYGIEATEQYIPESKRVYQNNDFIRKVNEDISSIKREYDKWYHYEFY